MIKSFTGVFAAAVVAFTFTTSASATLADNNAVAGSWEAKAHNYITNSIDYPSVAQRKGVEGQLKVRVKVAANRSVTGVELLQASGDRNLDRATVSRLFNLQSFPALPAGVSSKTLVVPVRFEIAD